MANLCASDKCGQPAAWYFESGGIGTSFCLQCGLQLQASLGQRGVWRQLGPIDDRAIGMYRKFTVHRNGDRYGKHDDCRYYVLDVNHDAYAIPAIRAYIDAAQEEFPLLAADLEALISRVATEP